eukprot:414152-Pelagomonas_calceolata.AAC.6
MVDSCPAILVALPTILILSLKSVTSRAQLHGSLASHLQAAGPTSPPNQHQLAIHGNNFSTVFTEAIASLPMLRGVYLDENTLAGIIPEQLFLGFLPQLEELGLYQNKLSGPLPVMKL